MKEPQSPGVKKNQSLGKALTIIEKMIEIRTPVKLKDLSAALKLPAPTILRFLSTLQDYDYVRQNNETGDYYLTLKLARLGEEIHSSFDIRNAARPHLTALSKQLGESVCLAIRKDDAVVYIDGVEGPSHTLRTLKRIGHRAPLQCTGVGKLMLLNNTTPELKTLLQRTGFEELTEFSLTTIDAVTQELNLIREQGYALDNQECEYGVRCVAAPVYDFNSHITAAISMTAPLQRMSDERISEILPVLLKAAREITIQMGGNVPQE